MFNIVKVRKLKERLKDCTDDWKMVVDDTKRKLESENTKLQSQIFRLSSSLEEAKAKIHKQTEADVYFECAKIMRELKNGKKVDEIAKEINHRDLLYAEMQRGNTSQRINPFQGLGMAGLLGNIRF